MGNSCTIKIPVNFVVDEVAQFRNEINTLVESGKVDFIFDFSQCVFIDSTGLGTLVSVYKKCVENNGSVVLADLNPEVSKLFELTRLDKVFDIH